MQAHNFVIGHRGASAYAPENTMAAFNKALALGCNFIEFDVMLSVDEMPFIMHDDNLKRTTNGKGDIGLVDAKYLNSLDAGSWFSKRFMDEKIPQLSTVLQWLIKAKVQANIEIKPYPNTTEATTVAVLAAINSIWPQENALPLVSSFDHQALSLCRSLAPEMPLGLLLDKWDENWLKKAKELQCYSLHLNYRILDEKRIKAIKAEDFKLFTYTVNSKRKAKKLLALGVDAVFSDYPDLLL